MKMNVVLLYAKLNKEDFLSDYLIMISHRRQ